MNSNNKCIKTVKPFGNTGGVYLPVKWIGKRVNIELLDDD